jgi:hypothetical protein
VHIRLLCAQHWLVSYWHPPVCVVGRVNSSGGCEWEQHRSPDKPAPHTTSDSDWGTSFSPRAAGGKFSADSDNQLCSELLYILLLYQPLQLLYALLPIINHCLCTACLCLQCCHIAVATMLLQSVCKVSIRSFLRSIVHIIMLRHSTSTLCISTVHAHYGAPGESGQHQQVV